MKTAKIIPIAVLCLMISVTLVSATHVSSITIIPSTWTKSTSQGVSLSVTNNGPDSIVNIQLLIPKDSSQKPLYTINKDGITTPQGWTFTTTGDPINTVTWIATGSGIASGSSLNLFGIVATSPSSSGNYKWSWTTTDVNKGTYSGSIITVVGQAPVSYFVISGMPVTTTVGDSIKFTVKAYGSDNKIKTDYTGTVTFSSTDVNAVLPADYTFKSTDYGSKDFSITLKSSGNQSLTVQDSAAGVSKTSSIQVSYGMATAIGIMPENKQISAGDKVQFSVVASDNYNNLFDVTSSSNITIDRKAGGSWSGSTYTSQNQGTWVVIASYNSLVAGTTLTVTTGAVTQPTTNVTTPSTNVTTPTTNVTTPQPEMEITLPDQISIAPGANDTAVVTVNNNGNTVLSNVEINVSGVPSDWISVYPLTNDIPAESSKDYLVIVVVPSNETGSKTLTFTATSGSLTATKNTTLSITSSPTGSLTMPKNILQLGVVIIAVAAVVIIGWELWFRKPKSK